jgi:hypothetical protein
LVVVSLRFCPSFDIGHLAAPSDCCVPLMLSLEKGQLPLMVTNPHYLVSFLPSFLRSKTKISTWSSNRQPYTKTPRKTSQLSQLLSCQGAAPQQTRSF